MLALLLLTRCYIINIADCCFDFWPDTGTENKECKGGKKDERRGEKPTNEEWEDDTEADAKVRHGNVD